MMRSTIGVIVGLACGCGPGRLVDDATAGDDGAATSHADAGVGSVASMDSSSTTVGTTPSDVGGSTTPVCGNGTLEPGEECDDGNRVNFDGCAWDCVDPGPIQVTGSQDHACAFTDTHATCWGADYYGELGLGRSGGCVLGSSCDEPQCCVGDDETVASVGALPIGGASSMSSTHTSTCAITAGELRCWGLVTPALGLPSAYAACSLDEPDRDENCTLDSNCCLGDDESIAELPVVDVGGTPIQVVSNGLATCVLFRDGGVRCWGRGPSTAQLLPAPGGFPDPALGDDESPAEVPLVDVGGAVVQLAAGLSVCALLDTGAVRCWGFCNINEQDYSPLAYCLGYGVEEVIGDDETPAEAGDVPLGEPAVQVSTSGSTTCVVLERGAVRCWGNERTQGTGEPYVSDVALAQDVDLAFLVKRVTTNGASVCALGHEGTVVCWGYELSRGELGRGDGVDEIIEPGAYGLAVDIGGPARWISEHHTPHCAVRSDDEVFCWGGENDFGMNGHGDAEPIGDDETPVSRGPLPLPW